MPPCCPSAGWPGRPFCSRLRTESAVARRSILAEDRPLKRKQVERIELHAQPDGTWLARPAGVFGPVLELSDATARDRYVALRATREGSGLGAPVGAAVGSVLTSLVLALLDARFGLLLALAVVCAGGAGLLAVTLARRVSHIRWQMPEARVVPHTRWTRPVETEPMRPGGRRRVAIGVACCAAVVAPMAWALQDSGLDWGLGGEAWDLVAMVLFFGGLLVGGV
jgi:hypothetical protein